MTLIHLSREVARRRPRSRRLRVRFQRQPRRTRHHSSNPMKTKIKTLFCRLIVMSLLFFALAFPHGARAGICDPVPQPTFTVHLPKLGLPPDEEGQGWNRPPVWEHHPNATDDSITVPNGRPIYALIVSGYASNRDLDELMVYNFARHLMARGAYVHYSWWNNLLAPYMERPLHHSQSQPG